MVMLLTENKNYKELLEDKNWVAEIKYDGNCLLVKGEKVDGEFKFYFFNRNLEPYTKDIPKEVLTSLEKFNEDDYCSSFTLHGELVYIDDKMQNHRTQAQCKESKPYLLFFDILELNGEDICDLTWKERKHELTELILIYDMYINKGSHISATAHYLDKKELLKQAEKLKMEGIVLKNIDGKYVSGRSKDNIKVKFKSTDEYIVIGYVDADEFTLKKGDKKPTLNKRFAYFGALILADYKDKELVAMGRVGGGFSDKDLKQVTKLLNKSKKNIIKNHTLIDKDYRYAKGKINWLDEKDWFVVEISMSQKTEYGKPFQPTFLSVRDDKKPKECVINE
jgi:bifunctional non-homologous end joining protein LigD